MKLQFPPGWYKSPEFYAGWFMSLASAAIYLDFLPHQSAGYKLLLLLVVALGGSSAVAGQFSNGKALWQMPPTAAGAGEGAGIAASGLATSGLATGGSAAAPAPAAVAVAAALPSPRPTEPPGH
jgi:hypothetical protein